MLRISEFDTVQIHVSFTSLTAEFGVVEWNPTVLSALAVFWFHGIAEATRSAKETVGLRFGFVYRYIPRHRMDTVEVGSLDYTSGTAVMETLRTTDPAQWVLDIGCMQLNVLLAALAAGVKDLGPEQSRPGHSEECL
jgi:hypothetical protein